jgi:hypothetical protein
MSQSLAELLDLYNAAAPLEEASTIPAPWYLDRRIEQAEREKGLWGKLDRRGSDRSGRVGRPVFYR